MNIPLQLGSLKKIFEYRKYFSFQFLYFDKFKLPLIFKFSGFSFGGSNTFIQFYISFVFRGTFLYETKKLEFEPMEVNN